MQAKRELCVGKQLLESVSNKKQPTLALPHHSNSNGAGMILVVKKKEAAKFRLVVDMRPLNRITFRTAFHLLDLEH